MRAKLQTWMRANPLLVLALAAGVGIASAEYGADDLAAWCAPLAVLLLIGVLIRPRVGLVLIGVAVTFAFLHAVRLDQTFRHPLRVALKQVPAGVSGTVAGSLVPDLTSLKSNRVSVTCLATEVILDDGSRLAMPAKLQIRMPRGVAFPGPGIYELHGRLDLPRASTNPGTFNAEDFALRSGFAARMDVDVLSRGAGRGEVWRTAFLQGAAGCRDWMSRELTRDLEHDPRLAGVIRAMALGVADEAQDDIEDAFRNSGTLHVFAVSGLHVALLGMIAWEVLKLLRLGRRSAVFCLIGLVFGYAFITGWRPSGARAAIMIALVFAAPMLDREAAVQNSLGLAALLILGMDTHQLFSPGFQLSFGVLWSIAAWADPLMEKFRKWTELDPLLPPSFATSGQRLSWGARRWLGGTLSVSGSAWAGSLVFILLHFQSVTPVTVLANCVLVPLSMLALSVTCLSVVTALLGLTGAQIMINNANWLLAKLMVASATWFAALPGANFHFQPDPTSSKAHIAEWRVLDLPDGAAANHLRVGDANWLLDTGPEDAWRGQVKAYLRSRGVNELRGVILSHNDSDHVGAVETAARELGAPALFCSVREPGGYDAPGTVIRRLLEGELAPRLQALRVGDVVEMGVGSQKARAVCLHPSAGSISSRGDDRAMVLMVELGPWRILWMSDAGWHTEMELTESGADLRCDVMIRSRHESDEEGPDAFMQLAAPQVVICSSDRGKPELALSAALKDWCDAQMVPLLDTLDAGSVLLELSSNELRVVSSRGGAPKVLRARLQ